MNTPEIEVEYLNDIQAARMLGLAVQTLRNYRCRRTGPPYVKVGRSVRYCRSTLSSYMKNHMIDPEEVN